MSRRRTGVMLAVLPAALAVDLLLLVVMLRGLHAGRALSIAVAFVVTVLAWATLGSATDAWLRTRRGTGP